MNAPYFGQDVRELEAACEASWREYQKMEPIEDLSAFNVTIKTYGQIWCDVFDLPQGLFVVAGVSGNMTGVPVAKFRSHDSARRYARDFEAGKCFTVQNDERWCDYVNAAFQAKKLNTGDYHALIARGRKSGIDFNTGDTVSQSQLLARYEQ